MIFIPAFAADSNRSTDLVTNANGKANNLETQINVSEVTSEYETRARMKSILCSSQ